MKLTVRTISFFLLPDFSLRALSSALETLKLANEVAGAEIYRWRIVSADGQAVASNCGMPFAVEASLYVERTRLNQLEAPNVSVICGGYNVPLYDPSIGSWLRACRSHRAKLVALGSGAFVVARAGLADHLRCAVHWELFPGFSQSFAQVEAVQTTFEIDGDFYSCPGGDTPFDMFLHLIEEQCGPVVANRVCEMAFMSRPRNVGERQRLPIRARHGALIKIIEDMEENVTEPLGLATLASRARLSRRQVERLFKQQVGMTPARYYLEMRLERAHLLLLTSEMNIIDVAVACGFVSASHFAKVYREVYGCTPIRTRIAAAEQSKRHYGEGSRVVGSYTLNADLRGAHAPTPSVTGSSISQSPDTCVGRAV